MRNNHLVPVLIVTYARPNHLKRSITSLQRNLLAEQTDLFVASDSQKSDADAKNVAAVRSFLRTVNGFRSVTIFERDTNYGVERNCLTALDEICRDFDRFIIMEEDHVTAPGFLKFINEAFQKFGDHDRVFSITGYCPPIKIPKSYKYDAFFLKRMSAWGCGFTKERYFSALDVSKEEYENLASNRKLRREFGRGGGQDMLTMLQRVADGSLNARDVRCMYTQFLNDQYTIYPSQSLVLNIGFDGTGMHCSKSDRFDVPLSEKLSFSFPDKIFIDRRIVKANFNFRRQLTSPRTWRYSAKSLIRRWARKFLGPFNTMGHE